VTFAIVWKELREQATIVVALLVLGCGLMAGLSVVLDPQERSRGIDIAAFKSIAVVGVTLLTLAAGAVIGATLFAGEREAGTFAFLGRLPATRWQIWWRKVVVGLVLAAVPAVGYCVTARLTGLIDGPDADGQAALLFSVATFFAFAWGTVGSVFMRTSLGACAAGLLAGVLGVGAINVVLALAVEVARALLGIRLEREVAAVLVPVTIAFTSLVLPLMLSAFLYTIPDRERSVGGFVSVPTPTGEMKTLRFVVPRLNLSSASLLQRWKRLAWLLLRQHRATVVWLSLAAVASGCLLLIPDAVFITAWPPLGLFFGVIVGVALFADEQGTESARFWGERRLRVGGLWGAKLAFGFGLLLWLIVLLQLPSYLAPLADSNRSTMYLVQVYRSAIFSTGFPILLLILLGPVYGLVFGQLAALLFRKPVVAAAVGVMLGGMAVALWLPSLFSGGLHAWQLLTPPLIVLGVSRLSAWPWATNRLAARGPLLRLACGLVLVAGSLAGGIAWRVAEVPEIAEVEDDVAFAKSLPSFDEKQSGRDVRRAVSDFTSRMTDRGPLGSRSGPPLNRIVLEISDIGYLANRRDVDDYLKQFDGGEWEKSLLESSTKPTGVFIDPNEMNAFSTGPVVNTLAYFQQMFRVYALRGLKAQQDGDPADFVGRLEVLLSVIRTTRTSGPTMAVRGANAAEAYAMESTRQWLGALRGRPELLRRALTVLLDHERLDTSTPRRTFLADQTIVRNGVAGPGQWLPQILDVGILGLPVLARSPAQNNHPQTEADVIAFMWSVPWERERLRRAVGFMNRPDYHPEYPRAFRGPDYLEGAPGLWLMQYLLHNRSQAVELGENGRLLLHRVAVLQVALRLFEAEAGRFPADLTELVPKYLAALPIDPFARAGAGVPLNYRVSAAGESIPFDPPQSVIVLAPVDPLAKALTWDGTPLGPDSAATPASRAAAVGAVTGSVVYWGVDEPLIADDGTAVPGVVPTFGTGGPGQRELKLEVAAGQPVLWSVGNNRGGGGGRVMGGSPTLQLYSNAADVVFVVPLQAKPPAKPKTP
jgi:ABC-type transport system involved in multi-copper enzyme maturation permease subunit